MWGLGVTAYTWKWLSGLGRQHVVRGFGADDRNTAGTGVRLLRWAAFAKHRRRRLTWAAVLVSLCTAVSFAGSAFALPPHVATKMDTDSCAMCHRGHTAASGALTAPGASGSRKSALTVGTDIEGGDVQLCYSCHGVDALGSPFDVQSEFLSGAGHSLAPSPSAYGPKQKQCSDCHDAHGTAKVAGGLPYPALLRAQESSTTWLYSGDVYCAACHKPRTGNAFPGLDTWKKTAHASIAQPSSGTKIVCSTCHTPHASAIRPNIVGAIGTPSIAETVTLHANDRTMCVACHEVPERTWEGTATYSVSAHGSSAATVAIPGEWAPSGSSRRVGECQACHAPMGASDGSGGAIPRLARKQGSALCYECHRAGGSAKDDLEALSYTPAPVVSAFVAFGADFTVRQFGEVYSFTRDTTAVSTPSGPRSFLSRNIGVLAAGDVEGRGYSQLIVARAGTSRVSILSPSKFAGLAPSPGTRSLLAPAEYLAVADVLDDADGRAELIAASDDTVRVYRWSTSGSSLDNVAAISVSGTISGLTTGRFVSGSLADIAVTTNAPDSLVVLTQDTPSSLQIAGTHASRALPIGPSAGDLDGDGHDEIAVANAGEGSPTLSIYSGGGTELMSAGSTSDASPTATVIGNVLPGVRETGTSGAEVALALGSPAGGDRIEVFARSGGGLGSPKTHAFAQYSAPRSLAVGDVDGDDDAELLVGLGGLRTTSTSASRVPALAIVNASADGTTLGTVTERSAGGLELAGEVSVLAANLGAVGPSRHPSEASVGTHVSTEAAPFDEHIACADCHNMHTATTATGLAPALQGAQLGAWGVNMDGPIPTQKQGVTAEYELCFKCHADYGSWTPLSGVRSVDGEFETSNPSFHPVRGTAPSTNARGQTLADGMTTDSRVNCSDCHGNASGRGLAETGQPNGPHRSSSSPLLVRPLVGAASEDSHTLCYNCHLYSIYGEGSADLETAQSSGFVDTSSGYKLHAAHSTRGFTCLSCHESHGSKDEPYSLRNDSGWVAETDGGRCTNGCHEGAGKAYRR